jgi:uncharacterized protein (TIGR03437 family)
MRLSQFLLRGALCLAVFAGGLSAQSIAVLTGSLGSSTSIPIFTANPLLPQTTATGLPAGAFNIYAKPDGSKYYVLTTSPGITILDRNFATPKQILAGTFGTSPRKGVFSPDGKRLFLIVASQVYVLDTTNDQLLNSGNGLVVTGTPVDVAFSHDGQSAFILSNGSFTSFVSRVDMTTISLTGTRLEIAIASASGITTAPNGLLYVSGTSGLFEINPATLILTPGKDTTKAATIPADNTYAGKVQFTSDSQYAVALNSTTAAPALIYNIPNKTVTFVSAANLNGASLDTLLLASDSRILVRTTGGQLLEMSLGGGFSTSPVTTVLPAGAVVQSMAASNEVQAKTLFIDALANGAYMLYRINLPTNDMLDQAALPNQSGQILVWAAPNPTSGVATLQALNTTQTVAAGGQSLPLVARVLDVNGAPVFGAIVNFSVVNSGVTLSNATAATNFNGFAQVYATAGTNGATASVQASVSGVTSMASYSITVPGGGGSGGGGGGSAAGLYIDGGNGQVIFEQLPANQLLMVIAKDQNGNPVSGQQVTFAITQGTGTTACTGVGDQFPYIPTGSCTTTMNSSTGLTNGNVVVTDAKGLAGVKFYATSIFNSSFSPTTITATSGTSTLTFYITTILATLPNGGGPGSLPAVSLNAPVADQSGYRIIRGTAGQTIAGAIQVQVFASDGPQAGQPIPNVALNVSSYGDPATSPSASCAGGTPLTDNTGTATCNLTLGSVLSASQSALNVNVGGTVTPSLISIVVAQGTPARIAVLQGNGQSGNPGAQILLKGQVVDSSGNPVANVPMSWSITQGAGTLSGQSSQSDASGMAQATLTLGGTPGNVVVQLTGSPSGGTAFSATFTATVNASIGGVTVVSGNGQTAVAGQPFGQSLSVNVTDNTGKAFPNVTVSFAVTSGSVTLSAPTSTTDSSGNASVGVTAGTNVGTAVVTASVGSQSATFTLTIRAPGPSVSAASFRNGASAAVGLTPCGIAIVTGPGLAPNLQGTVTANSFVGPLPYTLSGDSLTVNGIPAPIFWVSNTAAGGEAIAFQTPCEVSPGSASVVVTVNGGTTTVSNVAVAKYQPGIFTTTINGKSYAVVQRLSDGSFVTPDNPAQRGEQLKVFVTGLGLGMPATGTNKAGVGGQASDAPLTMGVNNGGVRTIGSEYLPGAIGIYTITFEVPSDTDTGGYQPLGMFLTDPADTTNTPIFALPTYIPIS